MHIWTIENWRKFINLADNGHRCGLRLRFDKEVDVDVKRACKEFAKWLRSEYFFPKRVVVYVKCSKQIKALDGDLVSGTFFGPYDYRFEPYVRIATGDYKVLLEEIGKDNALAKILYSIAHELTHYYQWINNLPLTEIGEERQAKSYSKYIIQEYAQTREHP